MKYAEIEDVLAVLSNDIEETERLVKNPLVWRKHQSRLSYQRHLRNYLRLGQHRGAARKREEAGK